MTRNVCDQKHIIQWCEAQQKTVISCHPLEGLWLELPVLWPCEHIMVVVWLSYSSVAEQWLHKLGVLGLIPGDFQPFHFYFHLKNLFKELFS